MTQQYKFEDVIAIPFVDLQNYLSQEPQYSNVKNDRIELEILAIDFLIRKGQFNQDDVLTTNACCFSHYWRLSELELMNIANRSLILNSVGGKADLIRALVPKRAR